MHIAKRLAQVNPSATLAVSQKTAQMKAAGADVIDLSVGQPDFTTPKDIADAAIASINSGAASFYTAAAGLPALRQAIADHVATKTGYKYDPKQIVVTDGAKFALYGIFSAILDPGDGVLIPIPGWVSYVEQVRLAGGVPQAVKAANGFKVTVDDLDAVANAKTRAIVINSPQNPSGAIYTKQELTLIGNWAVRHDILIVADEIYSDLVYNGAECTSMLELDHSIAENTVLVGGVSKSYAMTGWRIGFIAGPKKLAQAMSTIVSHATGNPAAASQYAAIAAYTGDQKSVESMRQAFEERLNTIYPLLQAIPGFEFDSKPAGAFYLFPKVSGAVRALGYDSTDTFVSALLEDTGVAVVAGRAFGMPDHIRLSYAKSLEDLVEAVARINAFVTSSI
ncbi:pyridoxal phosphate-dependent aminotransferase [Lacticaseibacillus sharpeae]|uniref:Aminotransferase n=1 Tax=Lacticaseibacillus sharpeae JCM 1186 = DSM 20505 TaxID=1291052 RepID=A0A0R1ZYL6_9LACO|nr:pyridoxal phosphate-dependent aminotransferase [Lacticaseibacillus sharpeae]KRM56044.1 aspartate tyrosine aromatic aminotransferase [Lacticaseibacillus sharpeae JCM 1186 = DSM 20505]